VLVAAELKVMVEIVVLVGKLVRKVACVVLNVAVAARMESEAVSVDVAVVETRVVVCLWVADVVVAAFVAVSLVAPGISILVQRTIPAHKARVQSPAEFPGHVREVPQQPDGTHGLLMQSVSHVKDKEQKAEFGCCPTPVMISQGELTGLAAKE